MDRAIEELRQWDARGLPPVRLALNLSVRELLQENLVARISQSVRRGGLEPSRLELELTETLIMQNAGAAAILLRDLRGLGVHIAIDDFGTGYSSLAYLTDLPITSLKIDRSFILKLSKQASASKIIRTIIHMAHDLGLRSVAEGIETPEQCALLTKLECDELQGYLFSRPQPMESLIASFAHRQLRARPRRPRPRWQAARHGLAISCDKANADNAHADNHKARLHSDRLRPARSPASEVNPSCPRDPVPRFACFSSRTTRMMLSFILAELSLAGFELDWHRVEDEAGFLSRLSPQLDVILSDYTLPRFNAKRTLTLLRESGYAIPCIVVTGSVGEEAAVACMRDGAADYLLKDRLSRLGTSVAHAIEGRRLRAAQAQLAAIAEWSSDSIIAITLMAQDRYLESRRQGAVRLSRGRCAWPAGDYARRPERRADLTRILDQVRCQRRDKQYETLSVTKEGRVLEVSASIFPVLNEDGYPVSAAAIIRDMTAEHERQRQAAQAARLRALGQLAGGVAHDLNQSLALILGYGDLVKDPRNGGTDAGPRRPCSRWCLSHGQAAADGGCETVKRLAHLRPEPARIGPRGDRWTSHRLLQEVALLTAPRWRDASQAAGPGISMLRVEVSTD